MLAVPQGMTKPTFIDGSNYLLLRGNVGNWSAGPNLFLCFEKLVSDSNKFFLSNPPSVLSYTALSGHDCVHKRENTYVYSRSERNALGQVGYLVREVLSTSLMSCISVLCSISTQHLRMTDRGITFALNISSQPLKFFSGWTVNMKELTLWWKILHSSASISNSELF